MKTLESLNTQYEKVISQLEIISAYSDKASEIKNSSDYALGKLTKMLNNLRTVVLDVDCSNYPLITDCISACDRYVDCVEAIKKYSLALLQTNENEQKDVFQAVHKVVDEQNNYEDWEKYFHRKYNIDISSEEVLQSTLETCVADPSFSLQNQAKKLRQAAQKIVEKKSSITLRLSDDMMPAEQPPMDFIVGRYPVKMASLKVLKDIGVKEVFQDIQIDLRNQGNVLISSDYDRMEDKELDEFVLAYIFRYIDAFPPGAVNIHIFDENVSYFYKRLCNSLQDENSGETAKKVVQLHTDLKDLSILRDVNCEDIFKKTSVSIPDLYAIHEHDKTDPFNLIVIRDGLIDGNGYVDSEILDMVNSLTRPGDTGHKCGLRFLIIDSSSYFEKNLTQNAKHLISRIQDNCSLQLTYSQYGFRFNNNAAEVLSIADPLDVYVQERAHKLAEALNKKEQSYVTIDDICAASVDTDPENILYIPVGKSGNSIVELPLSCKDEKGTVAGQCIGYMTIGQSGSGKSSFFHSLVINGCMKYAPKELQFWLLDFKNGGASSKYRDSGLPHIRMIAENNKIDDALCLFQMILEEMERRSKAFNNNFVDNIIDYNHIADEKNLEYFPRIIIAIDEVQEIFRDDNASVLQKLISSISSRMRSTGMHFIMVAQNLSEGKSYMLKDAFLPSATGRICFRVAPDIPRDSGFDDDFVQRKQEISELKTGDAYISYGKGTIKKVRIAYTSSQEMSEKYFPAIRCRYPEYSDMKPLIIGARQRLSIISSLQGKKAIYLDKVKTVDAHRGIYTAIIGEDVYRMSPLIIEFSQHENSSVLLLGSDRQISSSLCTSITVSLLRQNVKIHLFNGDRTKVQENNNTWPNPFMFVCQNTEKSNPMLQNHKLNEFSNVMKGIYTEYLKRQREVQKAEDELPDFTPFFLVINDLFSIESFINNEIIENIDTAEHEKLSSGFGFNYDIFDTKRSSGSDKSGQFSENLQTVVATLLKGGWRYNIHLVLAIKGDPSTWRSLHVVSEVNNIILFNTTQYVDQFDNSYYLKEMLRNICNNGEPETMAVWSSHKIFSKIRPIIYRLSDLQEFKALEQLVTRE